ncbi:MAG: VCBS repeat-containing protein, partial [Candidatus Cloacimonetes bacterium]|nr:VCBS repeat-containing protein [Candidatus Cloacimonadota bacterium]
MKKLLFLLMILFISVCYALEEVDIFDISGKYICSTEINYPEKSEDIIIVSSNFLYEFGKCDSKLSNGIYIVSKPKNSKVLKPNNFNRDFGYEDVTDEYFPFEEWSAGDIEIADINGDGNEDIVFSINYYNESLDSRPRIWIQTPTGNFIDETDSRIPDLQAPCNDIELFDIDSDNDIDIFLTGYSSSLYYLPAGLLINDGTGVFTDESSERLPQFNYPDFAYFAEAANLDDNQSIDLIVNIFGEPDIISYQAIIPEIWLN